MSAVFEALAEWTRVGRPCVIVTVVATAGSSPREAGAKMAVASDAFVGSIGGGQLELAALKIARSMIASSDAAPAIKTIALGPAVGQCCGGQVALYFEPQMPIGLSLAVFGAGHVAKSLIAKLADVPGRIDWIDPRAREFPEDLPSLVHKHVVDDPTGYVAELKAGTFTLVMTHSHELDYALISALLRRPDLPFIGLIGSMSKRARFEHRLAADGFDRQTIDRVICPIGIDGIEGKHPSRIAISVAAQLLQMVPADAENHRTEASQWAEWRQVEKH